MDQCERWHGKAAALAVAIVAASGCEAGLPQCASYGYYLVHYRTQLQKNIAPPGEERASVSLEGLRGHWKSPRTAAFHAPDGCLSETAGHGTGEIAAGRGTTVLQTHCGFDMAELERGLAQQHYNVISWKALHQVEDTQRLPTYKAAAQLGADIVFMVNSLEDAETLLGKAAQQEITVYETDSTGTPRSLIGKASTDPRDPLRVFVTERTAPLREEHILTSVTGVIDISAVDTQSGEAFWFFHRENSRPVLEKAPDAYFLLKYRKDVPEEWYPVAPPRLRRAPGEQAEDSWEVKARPEDEVSALKREARRIVIDDFIRQFTARAG